MKLAQAIEIVDALNAIARVLEGHSEEVGEAIIVGYETDNDPPAPNFYIGVFDELVEIGLPIILRHSTFDAWPYEAVVTIDGVEIRCMCVYADLVKHGLHGLPIEDAV